MITGFLITIGLLYVILFVLDLFRKKVTLEYAARCAHKLAFIVMQVAVCWLGIDKAYKVFESGLEYFAENFFWAGVSCNIGAIVTIGFALLLVDVIRKNQVVYKEGKAEK